MKGPFMLEILETIIDNVQNDRTLLHGSSPSQSRKIILHGLSAHFK